MTKRQPDERWDAILGMLESISSLDFSRSLPISEEADNMDAVALGLNMLSEELQANVVETSKLEEIVKELEWYRSMVTASSDLIVFVDSTFTYRAVNQAYCDEHRRTHDEIIGHTVAQVIGEELFEHTVKPHFERSLAGEQVTFGFWWDSPSRGRRTSMHGTTRFSRPMAQCRGWWCMRGTQRIRSRSRIESNGRSRNWKWRIRNSRPSATPWRMI